MSLFPHRELTYYFFGLRAGFANLLANRLQLGVRKTAGKITQPINSYTRFPEYYWFDNAISGYLSRMPAASGRLILDVGSPKTLGLYFGTTAPVELTLTDISELNVDEYKVMWQGLEKRAKGKVQFSLQDARQLGFGSAQFDIVYSMSVLEHIEGETGDAVAIGELLRVLKPGGLLVLSVPFGSSYIEQKRIGFSGAARKTEDRKAYFFQRIYDRAEFQSRILGRLTQLRDIQLTTVQRARPWMSRMFGSMGENLRGVFGGMNPLLSALGNRSCSGIKPFATSYGEFHEATDVYGDIILTGIKK
ncbi:MAG TPA: class I SAM-dependent methyltransferase [Candidatus Sulfotelmatobacter sp.]|nr:class I SAM-dependent methyltransferase [Candidatus Sulfotelmatobacter sp.]